MRFQLLSFTEYLQEEVGVFKQLAHNDLTKRGGDRVLTFLSKISSGQSFQTSKGEVVLDPSAYDLIKDDMRSRGFRFTFDGIVSNGNRIKLEYPKDFLKTPEFGGKGKGSGTVAEDAALLQFKDELERALAYTEENFIPLKINKRIVNCAGIISTPQLGRRAPKSDFSVIDENGKEVGWISHKDGSSPTHFQNYGGLTDPSFKSNEEVFSFVKVVSELQFVPKVSAFRYVKDKEIICKSIYGLDYGSSPGHENVDEFHQGPMILQKEKDHYIITSNHKGLNGDLPQEGSGYECIYYARYASDRGNKFRDIIVKNARIGVFPRAKAASTAEEI